MTSRQDLPIAVIGAGPTGLAAAAHLLSRDLEPLIFEAGEEVGASVREWGHVRVFSPWELNIDPIAADLLASSDWNAPAGDGYPTGADLVERYLEPLAAVPAVAKRLRLGARVIAVGRQGLDKLKDAGRDRAPFELVVEEDRVERRYLARAVIDASGTWTNPNPLGAGGLRVAGEQTHADRIVYGIPDLLGTDRDRYAGKRVLVVGGGHSAFNAILDLVTLRDSEPGTEIAWAIRGAAPGREYGGGDGDDQLPARGALGAAVQALVDDGSVELVGGFHTREIADLVGRLLVGDGERQITADEVIAATGFRPDLSILGELRLDIDDRVEATRALAPLIDPNVHSCGSVPPHGVDELAHPDAGAYIVGMKSYGRAPTFLLRTGYEQVRSVVAALAGDWDAARRVELTLPETSVSNRSAAEEPVAACCGAGSSNEPVVDDAFLRRRGPVPTAESGWTTGPPPTIRSCCGSSRAASRERCAGPSFCDAEHVASRATRAPLRHPARAGEQWAHDPRRAPGAVRMHQRPRAAVRLQRPSRRASWIRTGTLKRAANEAGVIPVRSICSAYFSSQARCASAPGASATTCAIPDRTTMSPPLPSPSRFSVTFGFTAMLRTRAPGWLYIDTSSPPSHRNPTGRGRGVPAGVTVVSHTTISSRSRRVTLAPNSVSSSITR